VIAAVNRSMRAQRTTPASSSAAAAQTTTNHASGADACFASSSSGSACRTCGPGTLSARTTYNQPVVARPTARKTGGRASLRHTLRPQMLARRQVGVGGVPSPQRPVVAARGDAQAVRDAGSPQQRCEREVLTEEAVGAAGA